MGLDVVHRRWLLAGPGLATGGFLLPIALLPHLDHRPAIFSGVLCVGAGIIVSFVSVMVALAGRIPPSSKWTRGDIAYLAIGALPLFLLTAATFVILADVSG